MPHDIEQQRLYVWVVETWLEVDQRWYTWGCSTVRERAWQCARLSREDYPGKRFRVTKYVSTKPRAAR